MPAISTASPLACLCAAPVSCSPGRNLRILAGLLRSSIEAPLIGLFLSAGVGGLLIASLVRWIFLLLMADPESPVPEQGLRVAVVTTFVPHAESIGMLERTVLATTKLGYPHDTWVLDEGNDQDVIDLCRRLGAYHFSRRGMADYQCDTGPFQSGTKHGNYNAWLREVGFRRYEILAGIDPDQVPYPDFLPLLWGASGIQWWRTSSRLRIITTLIPR